ASDRGSLVGVVVIDAITRYSRIAGGFDTLPAGAQRYQKTIVKKAQGVGYRQALSTDFFGDSRTREITTGEGHGRWQRGAERVIEIADHLAEEGEGILFLGVIHRGGGHDFVRDRSGLRAKSQADFAGVHTVFPIVVEARCGRGPSGRGGRVGQTVLLLPVTHARSEESV